jgi:hypothetical protein
VELGGGSGAGLRNVVLVLVDLLDWTVEVGARKEGLDSCFLRFERDLDDLTLA